jgi:quercetin dioxygenase-like cupin family protein
MIFLSYPKMFWEDHTHYVITGRLKVKLNDGTEEEIDHGDIAYVPPGHCSCVVL